jgi:hypothetical protein
MKEIFLGVYKPSGDGGEIVIRRSKVDEAGIHAAVEFLRFPAGPGYEWSLVAPAVAQHGFVVEPRSHYPVGHGKEFFFDFKLLRKEESE